MVLLPDATPVGEQHDPHRRARFDDDGAVAERAYRYVLAWLHSKGNPNTMHAYACDIGLRNDLRARLPGAPANPKPLPPDAFIPWALARGLDPCAELDALDAEAYARLLSAVHPDTKRTRKRRWAALVAFHGHLQRERLLHLTPDTVLGRDRMRTLGLAGAVPRGGRKIKPEQVRALLLAAHLATGELRERDIALIAVLAATGVRAQELVTLRLSDYQRDSPGGPGLLTVRGKGDKIRFQKLPARDCDLLDAYLAVRVAPPHGAEVALPGAYGNAKVVQWLFTTAKGHQLHEESLAWHLRRVARVPTLDDPREAVRAAARELAAVKDKLRPHQFRHGYVTAAVDNGVPVTQAQQDVGHADLRTTQDYVDSDPDLVLEKSGAQVVSDLYHQDDALWLTLAPPGRHEPPK